MIAVTLLFGCKNANQSKHPEITEEPKPADSLIAKIYTPFGEMDAMLEFEKTPLTVANFVGLAEGHIKNTAKDTLKPYFDHLTFHRIIEGFMIQGGDPAGDGSGGPGYEFPNEVVGGLTHSNKGVLAMANAGPNTNGSQFYITLDAQPALDGNYSVFGHLINGYETLDKIGSVKTSGPPADEPTVKIFMDSIRIKRVGSTAVAFNAAKIFDDKMTTLRKKQAEDEALAQKELDNLIATKFSEAKKTKSGLYYIIDKAGTGHPGKMSMVVVDYRGRLSNGKIFDESYGKQPIQFQLGTHRVIAGWEEGIPLFGKGGKGKLIVPWYLAYGNVGSAPLIPAYANLVFDIELMDYR